MSINRQLKRKLAIINCLLQKRYFIIWRMTFSSLILSCSNTFIWFIRERGNIIGTGLGLVIIMPPCFLMNQIEVLLHKRESDSVSSQTESPFLLMKRNSVLTLAQRDPYLTLRATFFESALWDDVVILCCTYSHRAYLSRSNMGCKALLYRKLLPNQV